jgi:hypothetical protein
LVSSIQKAFGVHGEKVTDVLEDEQGEEFLAHEVGLEGRHALPKDGIDLCCFVGYQKTALMIVASKLNREKNVAGDINWAQALKYVESVRVELGLTDEK